MNGEFYPMGCHVMGWANLSPEFNGHPLIKLGDLSSNGKVFFHTDVKLNSPITIAKCKEITETLSNIGVGVSSFEISLCDSKWFFEKLKSESPFEYSKKTARYDAKKNCLQIWDGEFPIYENNNGLVCKDVDALCDCLK